ncbi:hypothetical protein HNO88_000940 [Novosphingobium chloroacetimidivorans]|uniref:Uncharacterized protein n=1 Tax=Novosphingobium chloroacetimidivorans TaxID=1428314 RepID=A0A7W7NVS9_9SPHN|nr:hypothetical protein [Novosphingobium chloroacetimidivorans]MBB4857629.1 hypothetical protein [Novosphingobium chloroacetimidivorans]
MRISHHWLLVAALLVASAAPFAAPLLAAQPAPCPMTQGDDGYGCAPPQPHGSGYGRRPLRLDQPMRVSLEDKPTLAMEQHMRA